MNRDVLRTLAHEWVHEFQRTVLGRKKQKDVGSKNENEANAKAGEVIKKFEDKHPKLTNQMYEIRIKKNVPHSAYCYCRAIITTITLINCKALRNTEYINYFING